MREARRTAEARASEPGEAPQPHDETSLSTSDDRLRLGVRSGGNDSADIDVPGHPGSFDVTRRLRRRAISMSAEYVR
jgi:hypothetical protein